MTRQVLLIDDDKSVRDALAQTLELAEMDATTAGSFVEAKDKITATFDGVIVSDIRMPGRDGFYVLNYTREQDLELPVILLTGEGDIPMAVNAMGQGAFDFLEKPCAPNELILVIERALKTRALVLENRRLKTQLTTGDPAARLLFGTSDLSEILRQRVRNVARTSSEVVVSGAPGVGVSKVAEVIHLCSSQSKGPFGKHAASGLGREALVNAVSEGTNGSLFFDEITAMPMETQFGILNLLEAEGCPRLIFGSTKDLAQAVEDGAMHADLYYRLEGMQVHIPSLSERPEDIPVLFRQYVAQASEQSGMIAPEVTTDVVAKLMAREWPGNARALMSVAMRFVLGLGDTAPQSESLGLTEQMAQVERTLLQEALRRAEGRAAAAAQDLKLPRKTFYDKMAKHGLRPDTFK